MITTLHLVKSRLHWIASSRFNFLFFILLLFVIKANAQTKPNIIFILGDDVGYKIPHINGGKSYETPNLDSMAKQGMNFTQCHATPLCSPSRVMLLTGKHSFRNYTAWGFMDTSEKTIANMLTNAGYKTGCYGKWQLAGGGASIRKFGFDDYCVWSPYDTTDYGYRYKNPILYTNDAFLPDSLTRNKYGEDIIADSVLSFIDRNKSTPFFVYYSMLLTHPPFQPTPDDAAFASWNYPIKTDTSYFPSMVSYMDKKIGEILNKVKELGIEKNTIIIFTGDNGTPEEITQYTNDDSLLIGGKGLTTENGTLVPLMIKWKGTIKAGSVNNDLIGFTDFLPTLAHIANIPVPTDYGPLDGVDFYPRLKGNAGTPRQWLFFHYDAHPGLDSLRRWAQTKEYKLYDTSLYNTMRLFYNIKKDKDELDSIPPDLLTSHEASIKQMLLKVINGYIKEGTPILENADIINVSDSSAILEDSVKINGGSTIKTIGAVWSTEPNPVIPSSPHNDDGAIAGPFESLIKNLKVNTTYYTRVYAKNLAGIVYGNEIKFRTLINSPAAIAATAVKQNGFTANWHSIKAASAYKLDVSIKPLFANITPLQINQQFNNGLTPPVGWAYNGSIGVNDTIHKSLSPALQFKASNAQIITKRLSGQAVKLKFWLKGISTDTSSALLVEGFNGKKWVLIEYINYLPKNGLTKIFDSATATPLPDNLIQFRFTYFKVKGVLAFDNLVINYNKITPSFVHGYNDLKVNDTSFKVTGLNAATKYYYRVKAINSYNHSDNSNVISVVTCTSGTCDGATTTNDTLKDNFNADVFPNPTSGGFTLTIKNHKPIDVIITDAVGNVVYAFKNFNSKKLVFGRTFAPGIYLMHIQQKDQSKSIKLIKTN